jgi:hypothetical protein
MRPPCLCFVSPPPPQCLKARRDSSCDATARLLHSHCNKYATIEGLLGTAVFLQSVLYEILNM